MDKVTELAKSVLPDLIGTSELTECRRFQNDELVTISLDNIDTPFLVQKALLCNASEYFTKALSNGFKETKSCTLKLPDCHVDTFQLFLYWLCNYQLPDVREFSESLPAGSEEKNSYITTQQLQLVRLWSFAERFLLPKLQNETMRTLLIWTAKTTYIRAEAIALACKITSSDSFLTALAVKDFLRHYGYESDYGRQTYNEADINSLGATSGVMAKCLSMVSSSKCGMLKCSCSPSCYRIKPASFATFMVSDV